MRAFLFVVCMLIAIPGLESKEKGPAVALNLLKQYYEPSWCEEWEEEEWEEEEGFFSEILNYLILANGKKVIEIEDWIPFHLTCGWETFYTTLPTEPFFHEEAFGSTLAMASDGQAVYAVGRNERWGETFDEFLEEIDELRDDPFVRVEEYFVQEVDENGVSIVDVQWDMPCLGAKAWTRFYVTKKSEFFVQMMQLDEIKENAFGYLIASTALDDGTA